MATPIAPVSQLPRSRGRPSPQSTTPDNVHGASTHAASNTLVVESANHGNFESSNSCQISEDGCHSRDPSPAEDALSVIDLGPLTSTPAPVSGSRSRSDSPSAASYSSICPPDQHEELIQVPLLGYEIMEERSRFTVFRLQVVRNEVDQWFVFRRYTDFARLNDELRVLFPHFRLALPPKRWFGDNFDRTFLDDRMLGLQAFVNNISGHSDICKSAPVRKFLCLDEPPGAHESLEESRALCESLEETLYGAQREIAEKEERIASLEEELAIAYEQIENLQRALRLDSTRSTPCRDSPQRKTSLSSSENPKRKVAERGRSDSIVSAPCGDSGGRKSDVVVPTKIEFEDNSENGARNPETKALHAGGILDEGSGDQKWQKSGAQCMTEECETNEIVGENCIDGNGASSKCVAADSVVECSGEVIIKIDENDRVCENKDDRNGSVVDKDNENHNRKMTNKSVIEKSDSGSKLETAATFFIGSPIDGHLEEVQKPKRKPRKNDFMGVPDD